MSNRTYKFSLSRFTLQFIQKSYVVNRVQYTVTCVVTVNVRHCAATRHDTTFDVRVIDKGDIHTLSCDVSIINTYWGEKEFEKTRERALERRSRRNAERGREGRAAVSVYTH